MADEIVQIVLPKCCLGIQALGQRQSRVGPLKARGGEDVYKRQVEIRLHRGEGKRVPERIARIRRGDLTDCLLYTSRCV